MSQPGARARTEATQDRLFRAAVEAFAAKGFHGTSTRDIAATAGMSAGSLYVHHRSKEEILFRISRRGHETILALVRAARATSTDPSEQLRAVVHDFVAHHARAHTTARIVNYELAALDPEHRAEIDGLRNEIDTEVQDLVGNGVEKGAFDCPEPRIAAAALLSLGVDVARWYEDGRGWTPEQLGNQYAEVALRIVGTGR